MGALEVINIVFVGNTQQMVIENREMSRSINHHLSVAINYLAKNTFSPKVDGWGEEEYCPSVPHYSLTAETAETRMPSRKIVIIKRAVIIFFHKVADDSLVGE